VGTVLSAFYYQTVGEDFSFTRFSRPCLDRQFLREDFMAPLNLSANALAAALRVPTNRITAIIKGTRGITADTALRLGRYFRKTPEFWMWLQMDYDLRNARRENLSRVEQDVTPRAA